MTTSARRSNGTPAPPCPTSTAASPGTTNRSTTRPWPTATRRIRLSPRCGDAYVGRGLVRYDQKEYDKALDDYGEAIKINPNDSIAWNDRGLTWKDKGEPDKAIDDLNEAIRLDPKNVLAWNNRGVTWKDKGDYDKAVDDLTEALRLSPDYGRALHNRAEAWRAKREYAKAVADYDAVVRASPSDAQALDGRAWLLAACPDEKVRDGTKAVESAKKACELTAYKNPDYLTTLAAACAEVGDFDGAVKWQGKAHGLPRIRETQRRPGAGRG